MSLLLFLLLLMISSLLLFLLLCPLQRRESILLCTCRSVGPSVDNLVLSITRELIALGSSNLVWWLGMTSRWPLLNLRFLDQRSRSQWYLSLGGHTCFTNISCYFYYYWCYCCCCCSYYYYYRFLCFHFKGWGIYIGFSLVIFPNLQLVFFQIHIACHFVQ